MPKSKTVVRVLAVVGTVLVWLPIAAMLFFSLANLITRGRLRVDWLIPGELFPAVALGGALLLVAAILARCRWRSISWSLGLAILFLVGSQGLAVLTGLASGEIEPVGWPWVLVIAIFAAYALMEVVLGILGILLSRDLSRRDAGDPSSASAA